MAGLKQPTIGLALGSGGPRGLAHIGVIKVLEENHIPIDFIAGSSIGAMVGGFYAAKKDIHYVEKLALSASWKFMYSLLDPSFQYGLLGGQKVKNFIKSHLDGIRFENLQIPLSVIATNIRNGDVVVIHSGEVASAIRASISLPLVFKPVEQGDKLLADGGLSLPVPVEVARKMGADLVIAVNLDTDFFTDSGKRESKFGYYKIANNSINLLRHHLASWNAQDADVIIDPRVGGTSWNKFIDSKSVIAAGEAATKKILPQLAAVRARFAKC